MKFSGIHNIKQLYCFKFEFNNNNKKAKTQIIILFDTHTRMNILKAFALFFIANKKKN